MAQNDYTLPSTGFDYMRTTDGAICSLEEVQAELKLAIETKAKEVATNPVERYRLRNLLLNFQDQLSSL